MRHFVSLSELWRQSVSICLHEFYEETKCLHVASDETECLLVSYAETKCLLIEDVETLCLVVSLSDVSFFKLYLLGRRERGKSHPS